MWKIEADQIKGEVIRPAPMGTESDRVMCLVYEDESPEVSIKHSVVTTRGMVITAKTLRGLKGATKRAGLVWSESYYMP